MVHLIKNQFCKALIGLFFCTSSMIFLNTTHATATPLKLLTLNVWQFAYGIGSTNNMQRANRLATIIQENNQDFDVIGLQEMWSNRTREYVHSQIKSLYPYHVEDNQWGALWGIGFTSGLALYSKYPILKQMQHTYRSFRGNEDMAKKGLMGIKIEVLGKPAYIFVTHLQAGEGCSFFQFIDRNKPSVVEITHSQLMEARHRIGAFVEEQDAPVFFMGDFNISLGSEEYLDGMKTLANPKGNVPHGVMNTFDPVKSPYLGSDLNVLPEANIIDYIFTLGKPVPGYSIITGEFGELKEVSDHRGVVGVFELE